MHTLFLLILITFIKGVDVVEKLSKRDKILIGVSLISVGVAGYFGFKYLESEKIRKELTTALDLANQTKNNLKNEYDKLNHRVTILEEVISEDVLEEAIATTTRKYNYRCDKVRVYELKDGIDAQAKLQEHIYFRDFFGRRLKDFNE